MSAPPALIDSHAHLDFDRFDADRAAVLERAERAGVAEVITIGAGRGVEASCAAVDLAATDARVWASVGVHPHDADLGVAWEGDPAASPSDEVMARWEAACERALVRLRSLALHPKVVAVGEAGLDFHYDRSPRDLQRILFRRIVRLAVDLDLPLVIHAREAEDEVAAILDAQGARAVGGVIHCFTGHAGLAEAALKMGFRFGFTGIVTFPAAEAVHAAARDLPLDRLLVETDSPYLAPVPYRGKRNEPAYVVEVARRLAELRGLGFEELAAATVANTRALFDLDRRERVEAALAYRFKDAVYLNITNRCSLACRFCLKHHGHDLAGYELGLVTEPSPAQVLAAAERALAERSAPEVVFCGIGEPLMRPELVAEVGRALRARGQRVRVNTDGLASLVHGRDVAAELVDAVDTFSISLNAHDAATHARLCPSAYGEEAFGAVCAFIRRCVELFDDVTATVVAGTGADEDAARELAASLGAAFRVRG